MEKSGFHDFLGGRIPVACWILLIFINSVLIYLFILTRSRNRNFIPAPALAKSLGSLQLRNTIGKSYRIISNILEEN
jgi:hypothetical protein